MPAMMILNPKRRGTKGKKPSPAQLAARKKFVALAKARRAKLNPKKRRKATKAKKRRIVKLNPSPAPMKRKHKTARRRRSAMSWLRRRKAGVRRNPILPRSFMSTHLEPALFGAAGAIANDIAVGKLITMLPASLQKQEIRHLVKGVAAVGLSMLASKAKLANNTTIRNMTVGALTCVLHDAGRAQVQKYVPGVALGEYLSEVLGPWQGYDQLGEYLSGTYTPAMQYSADSLSNEAPVY